MADALDAFWPKRDGPAATRIAPKHLIPLFQQYAERSFDAHAEEYLDLFDDAASYEHFLRWELPEEIVVTEILPPRTGIKPQGSFDAIGLREPIGKFQERIGGADYRAGFWKLDGGWESWKPEGVWERLTEDACVDAIQLGTDFLYRDALVWALRDDQNRSRVEEILSVPLRRRRHGFVARWWEQAAKRPVSAGAVEQPTRPATIGKVAKVSSASGRNIDTLRKECGVEIR